MSNPSKSSEFAHLFELFEKLASRRSRAEEAGESAAMDETHTLTIPTDLQPVFRNLANLVTRRTTSGSSWRGRRNTVAVSSDMVVEDDESLAKFPMGKQYPFTFKMMLHKLYELEDWGKKVKDVLERSQRQFKPLAEKENVQESRTREAFRNQEEGNEALVSAGGVHFGAEFGMNSPKRAGRPRSHTVASFGGKGKESARQNMGSTSGMGPRDDERAVKKRCVGRRKSVSGMNTGEKAWFYDVAVASSEINERLSSFDTPVSPTVKNYGALQRDGRRRIPPRRRVTSAVTAAPTAEKMQQGHGESIKKRRATSVAVVKRS